MIVMTMAITASVNASSRPFVTARASHTKSPATEIGCDQNDLIPVPRSPVRRLPSPRVRQIDGLPEFGWALPVELKDLAHRRLEFVVTRTLAAPGDQLGVGADRQAERTVLCF